MSRWSVGDHLLGEIDGEYHQGLQVRTADGTYWEYEGQTWSQITGPGPHLTSVSSTRLLAYSADMGAPGTYVTYAPPVPAPHTRPGHYVCTGVCAYRFVLGEDGVWTGPYRPDGTKSEQRMTWGQLEDYYGDCSNSLVGPVPAAVLKGL